MTTPSLDTLIGSVSPSRLDTAQRCMAQFYFRYVEKLRERWRSRLSFGKACDDAGNAVYVAKQALGTTMSRSDVQEQFAAAWDFHAMQIDEWEEGDTHGQLLDRGTQAMAEWRDRIALFMSPTGVQEKISATVKCPRTGDEFVLNGVIDVRGTVPMRAELRAGDAMNRFASIGNEIAEATQLAVVADLKTAAKRYMADAFVRRSQPAAYTLLTGCDQFEFHVLVTTTTGAKTQVLRSQVTDADRNGFVQRAAMIRRHVAHAYKTGDWLPNRTHTLCTRRHCEFWATCEARFGGRVAP